MSGSANHRRPGSPRPTTTPFARSDLRTTETIPRFPPIGAGYRRRTTPRDHGSPRGRRDRFPSRSPRARIDDRCRSPRSGSPPALARSDPVRAARGTQPPAHRPAAGPVSKMLRSGVDGAPWGVGRCRPCPGRGPLPRADQRHLARPLTGQGNGPALFVGGRSARSVSPRRAPSRPRITSSRAARAGRSPLGRVGIGSPPLASAMRPVRATPGRAHRVPPCREPVAPFGSSRTARSARNPPCRLGSARGPAVPPLRHRTGACRPDAYRRVHASTAADLRHDPEPARHERPAPAPLPRQERTALARIRARRPGMGRGRKSLHHARAYKGPTATAVLRRGGCRTTRSRIGRRPPAPQTPVRRSPGPRPIGRAAAHRREPPWRVATHSAAVFPRVRAIGGRGRESPPARRPRQRRRRTADRPSTPGSSRPRVRRARAEAATVNRPSRFPELPRRRAARGTGRDGPAPSG